jgi:hypothetical protein
VPGLREEDERWAFARREGEEACLKRWSDRSFNVNVPEVSKLVGYIAAKVQVLQEGYQHFNDLMLHDHDHGDDRDVDGTREESSSADSINSAPLVKRAVIGASDRPFAQGNVVSQAGARGRSSRRGRQAAAEVVPDGGSSFE